MKTPILPVLIMLAASAVSLVASPESDQQATDAAMKTYIIRVLQNHVTVKVVDGVATLTGTTETQDGKAMVEDAVNAVPGVLRVDDKIALEPNITEHSDAWIAARIRLQVAVRSYAGMAAFSVTVMDGVVTLNGTTDSVAQMELVESYARNIDGVKSVVNLIGVRTPAIDTNKVAVEPMDDASITAQVKYALVTEHAVSAVKTKVTTSKGVVVITGEAASDAEKSLVTKVAESVNGVTSVTNNMTVKS